MNASFSKRRTTDRTSRSSRASRVPWWVKPVDLQCGYLIHGADTLSTRCGYGADTYFRCGYEIYAKEIVSLEGTILETMACRIVDNLLQCGIASIRPATQRPFRLRDQSKTSIIIIIMVVVVEACNNGPVVTRELLLPRRRRRRQAHSAATRSAQEVTIHRRRGRLVVRNVYPGQQALSHAPTAYPCLVIARGGGKE
jgi:hypothetical protein